MCVYKLTKYWPDMWNNKHFFAVKLIYRVIIKNNNNKLNEWSMKKGGRGSKALV